MEDLDDDVEVLKPAARPDASSKVVPTITNAEEKDTRVAPVQGELPFLVTHWLAKFASTSGSGHDAAAFAKIHNAAADLASAFDTLGAFGTVTKVNQCKENLLS
jgi:hypothetical protein